MESLPLVLQWRICQYLYICVPISKHCINKNNILQYIKYSIDNKRPELYRVLIQKGLEIESIRDDILKWGNQFVTTDRLDYLEILLDQGFMNYKDEFIENNTRLPYEAIVEEKKSLPILKRYGICVDPMKVWGDIGDKKYEEFKKKVGSRIFNWD